MIAIPPETKNGVTFLFLFSKSVVPVSRSVSTSNLPWTQLQTLYLRPPSLHCASSQIYDDSQGRAGSSCVRVYLRRTSLRLPSHLTASWLEQIEVLAAV